jgi:hypothetical protein
MYHDYTMKNPEIIRWREAPPYYFKPKAMTALRAAIAFGSIKNRLVRDD